MKLLKLNLNAAFLIYEQVAAEQDRRQVAQNKSRSLYACNMQ